jgi:hypothetical protein
MNDFLRAMQRFVAIESVGPSTVRSQGKGVLLAVREYLTVIDLNAVPDDPKGYKRWLNHQTKKLVGRLESLARRRPWGTARKVLNLFMRTAFYNHYLRESYDLDSCKNLLEVPLDSVTATALRKEAKNEGIRLPRWPGLCNLTPITSEQYQDFARLLASHQGVTPAVHLDIILWTANR